MIILQYRPPVEAVCVEFPAGLIDEGETPEQAAVRELKEETGYEGKVCERSSTLSNQPGMTNATLQVGTRLQPHDCLGPGVDDCEHAGKLDNVQRQSLTIADPAVQMVVMEVALKEDDEPPEQHLDEGEHIERIIVPLSELYDKLQGTSCRPPLSFQ